MTFGTHGLLLEMGEILEICTNSLENKKYAFTPVIIRDSWGLGIAVENEPGYNPLEGKFFDTRDEAQSFADDLNKYLKLSEREAMEIIITTMRRLS